MRFLFSYAVSSDSRNTSRSLFLPIWNKIPTLKVFYLHILFFFLPGFASPPTQATLLEIHTTPEGFLFLFCATQIFRAILLRANIFVSLSVLAVHCSCIAYSSDIIFPRWQKKVNCSRRRFNTDSLATPFHFFA
ncbi:hypothetical protein F4806DRAFT_303993 [Annulohypoxylon nitens]|nr:hypothetical protein F4806DRAFT_303993 [Annulohypoxylon nitens]